MIVNNNSFTNVNKYTFKWSVIKAGTTVETGTLSVDIEPLSSKIIDIPYKTIISKDSDYFINFEFITKKAEGMIPENWTIAYDQLLINAAEYVPETNDSYGILNYLETSDSIAISGNNGLYIAFDKQTGSLSKYAFDNTDFVKSSMKPDFYRVRIDNDDWDAANDMWFNTYKKIVSTDCKVVKEPTANKKNQFSKITVSVKYKLKAGEEAQNTIFFENIYTIHPSGKVDVLNRFTPEYYNGEANMAIPRIGQVVQINGDLDQVKWYGRGPWENYADRKTSSLVGIYSMPVKDLAYDYARPQENGYRTDVKWAELTNRTGAGLRIEGTPYFCFNAQYTSQENFFTKDGKRIRYTVDMKKDKDYHLNIDYGQKGVGGDNSWGKPVHTEYLVLLRYYEYGYSLTPIRNE